MSNLAAPQTNLYSGDSEASPIPGPWPWYVFVFIGYAIGAFFPWAMIVWGLFRRNRNATAAWVLGVNLIILILSGWLMATLNMAWWSLSALAHGFNLAWIVAAIVYQNMALGKAARRYHLREWKSWVRPIAIGLIIGFCISTIYSIMPAFEDRIFMQETYDSLDRQTVLWDFFGYSYIGLMGGLILGLWWAGEYKRFNVSHIVTFLCAFVLTLVSVSLIWSLMVLILYKGGVEEWLLLDGSNWAAIPPWVSGFRKFLLEFEAYNILPLLVIPLIFGAPARIRDFGKRALLLPAIFIISMPMLFTSDTWWETIQDQIVYEMHSDDPDRQAAAYVRVDRLLKRYPNHLQWPLLAEKAARYHYQNHRFEESRGIYQEIIERHQHSNQWYWILQRARAALNSPDFGKSSPNDQLQIPVVDYQAYLTHNWMALLSVMRYWEGPHVSESDVVIKLKDLSKSADTIRLNPLVSLAGLDDAARSLGYDTLLFRSDFNRVEALIKSGIPVIHQHYNTFTILFGRDNSRSAVRAYSFSNLSTRLRNEKRKEAKEILALEQEGHGESQKRLAHIANEAYTEFSTEYWQGPSLGYMGPLAAIVFPEDKSEAIANALEMPFNKLREQSDGYLASLIAYSYLNHGNPIQAIEWAKVGAERIADPLPLYIAHLAHVWWNSRDKIIQSSLNLQNQFPELAQIFSYFDSPQNQKFLQRAQHRFDQAFDSNRLPWIVIQRYLHFLDRSESSELMQILKLGRVRTSFDPSITSDWIFLANTYEWSNDISGLIKALNGAVSSNPLDSTTKLRLAFGYIGLQQYENAKEILAIIDRDQIRYDADYPFCMAALAEWQGNMDEALENYAAAIEMRRYKPIYHLRYGKLLIEQGFEEKAKTYLEWTVRTDAENTFKNEAVSLLAKIYKQNKSQEIQP